MDIKSLILDEDQLAESAKSEKERTKNVPVYTLDVDSGCDFAITKTKGRSVSQLICLISQKQFYMIVNKEKHVFSFSNDHELADSSNKKRLNMFLKEYEDSDSTLEFSDTSVIYSGLPTSTADIDNFIKTLSDEKFLESAKSGDAFIDSNGAWFGLTKTDPAYNLKKYIISNVMTSKGLTKRQALYNCCNNLVWQGRNYNKGDYYNEVRKTQGTNVEYSLHDRSLTKNRWYSSNDSVDLLTYLMTYMGYDNAKYVVDVLCNAYVFETVATGWGDQNESKLKDLNTTFDKIAFCNYVVYTAIAEGWAENYSNFFSTWFDTLNMQMRFYHKIKDKYPKNLATYHNIIAFKLSLQNRTVNENAFAQTVEQYINYEWSYGDYLIRIPRTSDEMIDEAIGQSNCLRSYIEHVAKGHCCIAFLRRKSDPDTSFVTIEIKPDKNLGEVSAAMNATPDGEALAFVKKWAEKFELGFNPIEKSLENLNKYLANHTSGYVKS